MEPMFLSLEYQLLILPITFHVPYTSRLSNSFICPSGCELPGGRFASVKEWFLVIKGEPK